MSVYDLTGARIAAAVYELGSVLVATENIDDTDGLAFTLADLRDLKTFAAEVFAQVEDRLAASTYKKQATT